MSGAVTQLAATGVHNRYLTADPDITLFKMKYKRHVHFSERTYTVGFDGSVNFGRRVRCTIPCQGDLITQMVLYVNLPNPNPGVDKLTDMRYFYTNSIGHVLIEQVELEFCNGSNVSTQRIDVQSGMWMDNWTELVQCDQKRGGFFEMIGKSGESNISTVGDPMFGQGMDLLIPLHFWFCRDLGSALPLVAMTKTKINVYVTFRPLEQCIVSRDTCQDVPRLSSQLQAAMQVDYVLLESRDRLRMMHMEHRYLMDQVQYCGPFNVNPSQRSIAIPLTFNFPVKELIWCYQRNDVGPPNNQWFNYNADLSVNADTIASAQLRFNGQDRTDMMPAKYFRLWQPYLHHTRITNKPLYVYCFSKQPEDINPSGSCNFSMLTNVVLVINFSACKRDSGGVIHVFATNHNVLEIKDGVARLRYTS